ncbi:MAG: hypothetical protein H7296_12085 [Bacteroidia bacterium]|nr:hypothetical protein [Bacteroidia bacterium]
MVCFTPVAFSASYANSLWSEIAFRITQSGGPLGTLIILLITGYSYTLAQVTYRQKTLVFIKSVTGLVLIFGLFNYVNEGYTKPVLKRHRPSHEFMLKQTGELNQIDSLYRLSRKQRQIFFDTLTKENVVKFKQIDPEILTLWVQESGFAFPSGHAFNAFLLAMVLAYAIYYN